MDDAGLITQSMAARYWEEFYIVKPPFFKELPISLYFNPSLYILYGHIVAMHLYFPLSTSTPQSTTKVKSWASSVLS
ncbi:hypothetical protein FA13DRAFT_1726948 [Coprinellus micaceus]|uniref:Uncharacterized protein n=1 Tax=Coprinellus micaceus TaxID=71717 RepID=A0A4Y7TRN1_COPMI|nr:hypothetical protein FA13DRAFT_1726948 [Coprinellus micaceus]